MSLHVDLHRINERQTQVVNYISKTYKLDLTRHRFQQVPPLLPKMSTSNDTFSSEVISAAPEYQTDIPAEVVVQEMNDEPKVGLHVGQCKWWSDKLGYGFVTIQQGDMKGKDIFLHHSGIRPLNSIYRTLRKGEYINFDVTEGANGLQATNVTGIGGGTLICDVNPYIKPVGRVAGIPMPSSPPRIATGVPMAPPPPPPYHPYHHHVPPPHTLATAAYITGIGGGRGAGGRGQRQVPFSTSAPNRPYYKPRPQPTTPPPSKQQQQTQTVVDPVVVAAE